MVDTAPVPLVSLFTEVEDPRRPQARRHDLEDILLMATLAVICGADSWTEVELFGRQKQAWLETFLDLPHGIPSHDTFGRVFARLDPAQLEDCFTRWVRSLAEALQGSGRVGGRQSGPPLPRCFPGGAAPASGECLVLGPCRNGRDLVGLVVHPARLEMLVLEGCIVTIDAMGCQKRIAQTIRDRGADYVLVLKDNHPQLYAAVVETFAVEQAEAFEGCDHDFHKTVNKNHGRIETRRCWVIGIPEYIPVRGSRRALARPAQPGPDRGPAATGGPGHLGDPRLHLQPAGGCAGPAAGRRTPPLGH